MAWDFQVLILFFSFMIGYMSSSNYNRYVVYTRMISYVSWGLVNILIFLALLLDKAEKKYGDVYLITIFLIIFAATFPYKKSSLTSHIHYTKLVPSHFPRVVIGLFLIHGFVAFSAMCLLHFVFMFTVNPILYLFYPTFITLIYVLSFYKTRMPYKVPSWMYGRMTDGIAAMLLGYAIYHTLFTAY